MASAYISNAQSVDTVVLSGQKMSEVRHVKGSVQKVIHDTGKKGKCFSFMEKLSNIKLPLTEVINPKEGTIEMWVKNKYFTQVPPAGSRAKPTIFGAYYGNDRFFRAQITHYKSTPAVSFTIMKTSVNFKPLKLGWTKDQWHHLAFSWGNGKMKIYVDGAVMSEANSPELPAGASWQKLIIGACPVSGRGTISSFCGLIDEIVISKRERTASEIANDYKAIVNP